MIYYLITTFFIYLLGLLEIIAAQKSAKIFSTLFSALILILFAGLKVAGSTDYQEYKELFIHFDSFDLSGFVEPGYQLLMALIHWVGGGFLFFYFMVALFNVSVKTTIMYKLTPYVGAALLIYFCGCFFERDNDGIRQGLSMSICFIALYYLVNDRIKKYYLFTILAVLFHYSSIIFFLTIVLKKIKWSTTTILFILGGSYIISFTGTFLTQYLVSGIPIEMVSTKLDIYASTDYSEGLGITVGVLFRTFLLILFMHYRHKINIHDDLYFILRNGLAISIVCTLIFGDFAIIAHRLPYVFREFQIFIVPYLISALPNKGLRLIGLTIVFAYTNIILSRFFISNPVYNNYHNLLFI